MTVETMEPQVAKAKRNDTPVRIDNEVLEDARVAASLVGKTLGEFLSETLRPIVKQIIKDAYARRYGEGDPPAKPKR